MLFGVVAFKRESAIETMNAVVHSEPARLAESGPDLPVTWELILRRCLEKSPERRFQLRRVILNLKVSPWHGRVPLRAL